jgi:hypothetical protein
MMMIEQRKEQRKKRMRWRTRSSESECMRGKAGKRGEERTARMEARNDDGGEKSETMLKLNEKETRVL